MHRIVVGRGRSDRTDGAMHFAEAEAQLRGQPVAVIHVWDLPVEVSVDVDEHLAAGVTVTASAITGTVAPALMSQHPDLLVLGQGSVHKQHLSHTVRSCLHHLACPVVIVPPTRSGGVDRIVVGVSETPASAAALDWAATEARLHGAELVVLRAWQILPHSLSDAIRPARAETAQQQTAQLKLQHWVRKILPATDATVIARHGGPLDVLLEASQTADLLVLGHSAHGRLGHAIQGHIADELIFLAQCPVAVIPNSADTQ